jgi:hypothetical protein
VNSIGMGGVILGVQGAFTDLIKSVICQVLAGRPWGATSTVFRHRVLFHRLLESITAMETHGRLVTPTFYNNKKICANRSAYKNAYQTVVHMKNFQKNKSCIGCIAWHGILYFSKILEEPRRT